MAPLASLCIPTHNRASFLARTLTSLATQDTKTFEIVIVDDGSTDETRDVVTSFADELEVRYIRRAHTGRSMSRNAAIRAARGDLLIFCDDDRVADPNFVTDHLAAHVSEDKEPRVVVGRQRGLFAEWSREAAYTAANVAALIAHHPELAPRLAEPRAELVTTAMLRGDLPGTLAAFAVDEPWWESYARPIITTYGPELTGFRFAWTLGVGGNVSVPRVLAERVGLHDERFVGWGLEDTEFHYRLHRAGARTVVADRAVNYHQVHQRGPERLQEWSANAIRFLAKHDTLEVYLYIATCRRGLTLGLANQILVEHDAIAATAPNLVAELVRVHKEQFRFVTNTV